MNGRAATKRTRTAACVLLVFLGLTASCAGLGRPPLKPESPAGTLWRRFAQSRLDLQGRVKAMDAKASINISSPQRNSRLVIDFWGNLDYPLRLDLSTGFGAPVAFSREDGSGFIAFDPNARVAYLSQSGRQGAEILGLAMPFDLKSLAGLAAGTYFDTLPDDYAEAEPEGGGWRYEFSRDTGITSATLDGRARLTALGGNSDNGPWTLALTDFDEEKPDNAAPRRLTFEAGEDVKAIIRIKDLRRMPEELPEGALSLALPPGTRTRILEP